MVRWMVIGCSILVFDATISSGQMPARTIDPVFTRAQQLVSDGNGAAGRAVIDSVIAANSPSSRIFPQALYWRASLAASAADAESDYKHIVVDYPLAPEAEDALLRLAQLELARGDRDGALAHLQKIPRDYPRSKSLARSSYWTARVFFEKNDLANACAANASAQSQVGSDEVELLNQIQYQGQRCAAPIPTVVQTSAGATSSSPDTGNTSVAAVEPPRPKPPPTANDAKPSMIEPPRPARSATAGVSGTSAKSNLPANSGYSVQVAAYKTRPDAQKLVSTLTSSGYDARVDEEAPWFRVRIGRYTSASEAEGALKRIKAKHMDGFVVKAPAR